MAKPQTVSINEIRADVVRVTRGLFFIYWVPAFSAVVLILPAFADLHLVDGPLRWPVIALLVALTCAGFLLAYYGTARMTAFRLWIFVIAGLSLIAIGAALVVTVGIELAQDPAAEVLVFGAVFVIVSLSVMYWVLVSPTIAALRLLATRIPPDGTSLPAILASPLPQRDTNDAVPPSKSKRPVVVAYRVAAVALGIVTFVLVGWSLTSDQATQIVMTSVLAFAALCVVTFLWRRGRKHAAVDADAAQQNDSRRPILYLRSFQDDPHLIDPEWDMVMRTGWGRAGHRRQRGPIGRLIAKMPTGIMSGSGGRLEERLAAVVAPIGPFIAIGAPGEPLPELGAARAYFSADTWQDAVIKLMDTAQLIVTAAGPTSSIRWEFQTVLDRNAWPKLVVLMPPSTRQDHAARWATIIAELQGKPWSDAVACLDLHQVIAMRLLDGGEVAAVTSDRRLTVDYVLAMRIMLHQMHESVPS